MTKCTYQALAIQLPFHQYEEKIWPQVEGLMPERTNNYVEQHKVVNNSIQDNSTLELDSPIKPKT